MPSEPDNRKIEELLKAYGKKRQEDVGAPLDLHPATRKMLQGEVAKLRPSASPEKSGLLPLLLRFWPRFAIFGGMAVLLSLAIVNINRHPDGPQELALNKNSKQDPLQRLDSDKDLQPAPTAGAMPPTDKSENAPRPTLAPVRERNELLERSAARKVDSKSESEVRLQRPLTRDDSSVSKRLNEPSAPSASTRLAAKDAESDGAAADGLAAAPRQRFASDAKKPAEQATRSSLAKARPSAQPEEGVAQAKANPVDVNQLGRQAQPGPLNEPSIDSLKLNESFKNQIAQSGIAPAPGSAPTPTFGFDEKGIAANGGLAGAANKPSATAPAAPSLNYDAPQPESFFRQKESKLALGPATQPLQPPPPAVTAPSLETKVEEQESAGSRGYAADRRKIGPVRFRSALLAPARRFEEIQLKKAEAPAAVRPLASTFDFQQSGETIQIVDADGSIYDGRLLLGAPVPNPRSTVDLDDLRSRDESKLKQSSPLTVPQTGVTFTASGTNLSLGKLVVIRGDLIGESTPAKVTTTASEKVNIGRAAGVFDTPTMRPAGAGLGGITPGFTVTPFVPAKIQGTLRVDRTNEFPIDATRMTP